MNVDAAVKPSVRPERHLRWPLIVIGLLLGHMAIMFVAVVLATRDRASSAVIPDYYQKAVDWDRTHASPVRLGGGS